MHASAEWAAAHVMCTVCFSMLRNRGSCAVCRAPNAPVQFTIGRRDVPIGAVCESPRVRLVGSQLQIDCTEIQLVIDDDEL